MTGQLIHVGIQAGDTARARGFGAPCVGRYSPGLGTAGARLRLVHSVRSGGV